MRTHRRRLIALSAGLALAASAQVTTSVAGPLARATASDIESSAVAVTGIVRSDGQPIAGADVVATLWPKADVRARIPIGGEVKLLPVAAARTDATGSYKIRIPATGIGADYISDGRIDLDLTAADKNAVITQSQSVRNAPSKAGVSSWASTLASASEGPPRIDFDLTTGFVSDPLSRSIRADATTWAMTSGQPGRNNISQRRPWVDDLVASARTGQAGLAAQAIGKAGYNPGPAAYAPCKTYKTETKSVRETFTKVQGVSAAPVTIQQDMYSAHTLGVAASANGKAGSWSVSGSSTLTTGASASHAYATARNVKNQTNYGKYVQTSCAGGTKHTYRPDAISVLIVSAVEVAPTTKFKECTPYSSGRYVKSTQKNLTVTGGVDLDVIKVDAQAGWTTHTSMTWEPKGKKIRLCGSDNGWSAARWAGALPG